MTVSQKPFMPLPDYPVHRGHTQSREDYESPFLVLLGNECSHHCLKTLSLLTSVRDSARTLEFGGINGSDDAAAVVSTQEGYSATLV